MIVIGLLLVLGVAGISLAAMMGNQDVFSGSAGTIELFNRSFTLTNGELFIAGAALGAVAFFGLMLLVNGMGHRSRKRSVLRRRMRADQQELRDLRTRREAEAATARSVKAKQEADAAKADSEKVLVEH